MAATVLLQQAIVERAELQQLWCLNSGTAFAAKADSASEVMHYPVSNTA
jgi:hypothetical protein